MGNILTLIRRRGGLSLPYLIDFTTLPDGDLPKTFTAPTWSISGGTAANTPTEGPNMLVNGDMESGDPPVSWTLSNGSTLTGAADERTGGVGIQSINVARGSADLSAYQGRNGLANTWFKFSAWGKNIDATDLDIFWIGDVDTVYTPSVLSANWTQRSATCFYRNSTASVYLYVDGIAGEQGRFDDVAVLALTHNTLFAVLQKTVVDVICKAAWNLDIGDQGGVIVSADSDTNPQSFVIAFYDRRQSRNRVYLYKVLSGVYTLIDDNAAAYVAGADVELRKSGTTYQVFYNNVQIGSDEIISDSEIIDSKYHGFFGAGGGGSCDAFFCSAN